MPIYEYECQKCGHTLEALQKFSDKPLRECPECGKHQLKRLMSAPMFRLAGSGWYETDFKSDKETKRNIDEKGDKEPARRPRPRKPQPAKTEAKAETAEARRSRVRWSPSRRQAPTGRKPKPAAKKKTSARARKR